MIQRMNRFGNGRGDSCLAIAVLIVGKILNVETKAANENGEIDLFDLIHILYIYILHARIYYVYSLTE